MKFTELMAVAGTLAMTAAVAAPMESQWKGKKVAFLGDSITDHCTSATNYWGYLELDLGLKPLVYGINGHQMSMIKGQAEKLKKDHGDDVDAIFIFAGTNDYYADVPLGKWYDYTMEPSNWRKSKEPAPRRHFTMDGKTFRSRINIALGYMKDNFPDAQVILVTPIHRGFADFHFADNVQPDESFGNPRGLHIEDYVNVVKEAGDVWCVPVINLFGECGLYPTRDSFVKCFRNAKDDRLHPNPEGHRRMAEVIKYRILAMPSTYRK